MNRNIILTCAIVILAVVALVTFSIMKHENRAESLQASNIGKFYQLGLSLKMYAIENDGMYPSNWVSSLKYVDYPTEEMFLPTWISPASRDIQDIDSWSPYRLVQNRKRGDAIDTVLGYLDDPQGGGYILFVDGRVEWMQQEDFEKISTPNPSKDNPKIEKQDSDKDKGNK